MNIKSIIFADATNESFAFTQAVLSDAFSAVTGYDENTLISVFPTVQSGMKDIASALKSSSIIAIFADDNLYHEAKETICKAFRFEMIHSESVVEKLRQFENHERYLTHALIPGNATEFSLSDGLFPGFAVRSKSQCIFFLPFSQDRTFITMKKFVFPYISRFFGEVLPSFSEYETAYAAAILEDKLYETNAQVALANTPVCKYIALAGKKIDCWSDTISYAPYDKEDINRTAEGVAAIKAAEYYECQFGAAVTEGPKDDYGCFTATIIISNNKTATIRTLSSIPDEDHDDFMNTVVTEFFLMLANELESTPVAEEENEKYVSPRSVIHGSRIFLYIALLATTLFLSYVAVSFADLPIFS
ncbi:MAG: hypothetical protein IKW03_10100 [Clostridia bacterium]|nr:hypothetical protein [Clostridia bacterium]